MSVTGLIATMTFRLRPGLGKENPVATVERLPLDRCRCTLGTPASEATTATTLSAGSPAVAAVSSSTLAVATVSAGEQSFLASHWRFSLGLRRISSNSLRGGRDA